MKEAQAHAILNHAFVTIYRSYGMYLREAWPNFDIGDEAMVQRITDEEERDAARLGQYIFERCGDVNPGHVRMNIGDIHYINFSRILPEWVADQQKVLKSLEDDCAALTGGPDPDGLAILKEVLNHERAHLARLYTMLHQPVAV